VAAAVPALRSTGVHARIAVAGMLVAVCISADLHLRLSGQLSPLQNTLSEYVYGRIVSVGSGFSAASTFSAMCLAFVLGSAALLAAIVRAYPARRRGVVPLLGVWCTGLLVCALVPVDAPGSSPTWHGDVHNIAAISAFVALPVATLLLIGRSVTDGPWARNPRLIRGLAVVSLAVVALLIGSAVWMQTAAGTQHALLGLYERVLFAVDLALLLALTRPLLVRRAKRTRRNRRLARM